MTMTTGRLVGAAEVRLQQDRYRPAAGRSAALSAASRPRRRPRQGVAAEAVMDRGHRRPATCRRTPSRPTPAPLRARRTPRPAGYVPDPSRPGRQFWRRVLPPSACCELDQEEGDLLLGARDGGAWGNVSKPPSLARSTSNSTESASDSATSPRGLEKHIREGRRRHVRPPLDSRG